MGATAAANALALPPNTPSPLAPPAPSLPGDFLFGSWIGRDCLKILGWLTLIALVLLVVGYLVKEGIW